MKKIRGLKFRIYPTEEQKVLINKTLGCARFVYNYFLKVRHDAWEFNHKGVYYADTNLMLTELKRRPEYQWLREVDCTVLQNSLIDLEMAYKNFFDKRAKYPKFKSRYQHTQSCRSQFITNNIRVEGNGIRLPKVGIVKTKFSRPVVGEIANATIIRAASGKYFVSLCVKHETDVLHNNGGMVGLDVGVKEFFTDSDGNKEENPRPFSKLEKKLAREQRRLSRKMRGSGKREKQRIRVARLYEYVANSRKDHHHKLSTQLAKENKIVVVEDLRINNMMKNKYLSKAVSDASWYSFFEMLEYKLAERGGQLIRIPTSFPSANNCFKEGELDKNSVVKDLKVREWVCPSCGARHDRDVNAAINIKEKGLEMLQNRAYSLQ